MGDFMKRKKTVSVAAIIFSILFVFITIASADGNGLGKKDRAKNEKLKNKKCSVQLGPRPYYLVGGRYCWKIKTVLTRRI